MKRFILLLCIILASCDNCDKPTKRVCIKSKCHTEVIFNAALKMPFPITVCTCVETKIVDNECYKGENNG